MKQSYEIIITFLQKNIEIQLICNVNDMHTVSGSSNLEKMIHNNAQNNYNRSNYKLKLVEKSESHEPAT